MTHPDAIRIDRIIDTARGVAPAGPGERNNREANRIPYARQVALVPINAAGHKGIPIVLTAENISSGGLCVISDRELSVGGRGAILMQKSDGQRVMLGGRVVYVNALGEGCFECGLEFEIRPSIASMADFDETAGYLPATGRALAA
jgi:hypothetical protein